jgi:hypothetical protein
VNSQQITEIAKLLPGGTIGALAGILVFSRTNEPCATSIDQLTSSVNTLCENYLNSHTPDIALVLGTAALAVVGALISPGT